MVVIPMSPPKGSGPNTEEALKHAKTHPVPFDTNNNPCGIWKYYLKGCCPQYIPVMIVYNVAYGFAIDEEDNRSQWTPTSDLGKEGGIWIPCLSNGDDILTMPIMDAIKLCSNAYNEGMQDQQYHHPAKPAVWEDSESYKEAQELVKKRINNV